MRSSRIWLGLLALLIAMPSAALAFYKPTRVLVPSWFGVTCTVENICIDDLSRLPEAVALRDESVEFVTQRIGAVRQIPRYIFCSTAVCANRFGQYHAAAYNVGTFGIVIRTKGWKKHYARHELIHHLQNERLGSLRAFLFKPTWFLEGMAYSLSEDPRSPIPNAQLESYRERFNRWNKKSDLWGRAKKL